MYAPAKGLDEGADAAVASGGVLSGNGDADVGNVAVFEKNGFEPAPALTGVTTVGLAYVDPDAPVEIPAPPGGKKKGLDADGTEAVTGW